MTILSFSSGQTATQLIGSGTWKTIGNISFTASYNNPPPASASINVSGTGVSWSTPLVLTTPFTSKASTENTSYTTSKDQTITFTLTAYDGATARTLTSVVTFRNNIKYGISTATSWDSAAINALSGTTLSNTYTGAIGSINASTNDYLIVAHPSSYTSIHATGFIFNSIACPFEAAVTVSVTNTAGFTENYKVYRSTNKNMGNSTLTTATSSNIINPIYYGTTTGLNGFTEATIEGLATNTISNTKGRSVSITTGANDYMLYCLPTRLGTVTFTVNGFTGGFESPETVSVTNINGYTENYYVYRSTNKNLGSVPVVIA